MKFIIDECVGKNVAQWLRQKNYDVISVYDDMRGINDNMILTQALMDTRIIITNDKDFGEIVFKNKRPHCGILLLRLIDETPTNKIRIIENVLQNHLEDLSGNFVVATESAVRVIRPSMS